LSGQGGIAGECFDGPEVLRTLESEKKKRKWGEKRK